MDKQKVIKILQQTGYDCLEEKQLANQTGVQLRLKNGGVVNIFKNGTVSVQGKERKEIEQILSIKDEKECGKGCSRPSNKVFVVYGHDVNARHELEAMLRRWGLEPVILDQLPSEGATLIEKLENYYHQVGFAVVLATPDDEGFRKNQPEEKAYRARQNVVLEMGMLLAFLGRKKVAILLKDQDSMERPSDIQGLIYIPFKNDIAKDAGLLLAKEMVAAGYDVNVSKI